MQVRRTAVAAVVMLGAAACGGSSSGNNAGSGGGGTPAGPVQHPTSLKAQVGKDNSFSIALTDQNGKSISNLAAGTYKLEVQDFSTIHNFHLFGSGGVNDSTPIGSAVTKQFTVKFAPGTYTFQCDTHASQMHGTFKVS